MSERLGDLTSRERELVDAAASGDVLECSQLPIEQLSATDDPEHTIRAELLRELLLKRCNKPPDPRGVRLRGARITGTLDLTGVEVPVGVELQGCSFDHPMLLEGAHLRWLTLLGSCLPALHGAGLQVDLGLFLQGLRATGHGDDGAVRLPGARITGQLVLSGAELTSEAGPALGGDRLQVDGDVFLQELRATGHGDIGAVQLRGAHIIGALFLRGAVLTNKAGPALVGDGLQIDGDLFADGGFRATGHSDDGAVRLVGARIGGQLALRGAKLTNKAGPALDGDRLQVDDGAFLDRGFRATGHSDDGAVRLLRAHITVELTLRDAVLTNKAGPALVGDRLQVDGDVSLQELRATGHGERAAVRLYGARITDRLSLFGAELTNEDGLLLDLEYAEAKTIFVPPRVLCPRAIRGSSNCDATARRVDLSGLVYTSLEGTHWNQWLHLIARHTDGYRPQPYQQLAAVRRAAGHDADARKILIVQQQDLRERGYLGGWPTRTVHYLWGKLGGYGYRTRRTAVALLIVLLAAGGLGIFAGCVPTSPGRYVAMHTPQADASGSPCSLLEQIGVGIDRGLPLATTGVRSRCDFDTINHWGQVITAFTWILQLFVWVLATGVVAGYVGLIRKAT